MIKVENIDVQGWEHAIRGMRNPMNSWNKSDSVCMSASVDSNSNAEFKLGNNDLDLMRRLYAASKDGNTAHRKYLRQICVWMDITAPLYWWKEFDTYKVGTTSNSCSTMHKIHSKEFTFSDFSYEHIDQSYVRYLADTIDALNALREQYNEDHNKDYWYSMIQLLPSSYNQRRTVSFNYEVAMAMIQQRSGHKLDEWREFVDVLMNLPYLGAILDPDDNK